MLAIPHFIPIHLAVVSRFPRPEFETGHQVPSTSVPMPPGAGIHVLDLSLLLLALTLAALIALKWRSRRLMAALSVCSLVYFGFVRHGCLCSVGSLQNVALALGNSTAPMPWYVFFYFAAPLVFALFFGRVFCGGVCPLGMLQDVVAVKPTRVPSWIERALGLAPYLYLGLAVLFAATGTAFIICRFDPFVGFFRFSGPPWMILAGALVLLVGVFVARPYCRYLCPYGVLLRWASLVSWRHLTITPPGDKGGDECVVCSLCVDSCPFGAIRKPAPEHWGESGRRGMRRLAHMLLLAPVIVASFGYVGYLASGPLARYDRRVFQAEARERSESASGVGDTISTEIKEEAKAIRWKFAMGATAVGAFLGLAVAGTLVSLSVKPKGTIFHPDKMKCLSCARCVEYCPLHKRKRDS